ncbi:MAG: hypothetical protein M1820_001111 [Bogoriella megaspora]|nr:MAG: hypothetical protein M1820_001111 [Bogoriella megaspora]
MAANDYYNEARYDSNYPHNNTSLPPGGHSDQYIGVAPVSPVSSRYSDHTYSAHPSSPSRTSVPSGFNSHSTGPAAASSDPYTDHNAVPLRPQGQNVEDPKMQHHMQDSEGQLRMVNRLSGGGRGRRTWKQRFFGGKITWVVYFFTIVQIIVFIVEIVKNATLTHTPIEIHPQFNPMIGPSPYVLINMGARYVPCMRNTEGVQDRPADAGSLFFPCPNTTSINPAPQCSLSQLCGFSDVPNPHPGGSLSDKPSPNQWYRFIIPMFLHAGLIHIGFNLLLQMTLGRDMERSIGSIRFLLIYIASGIFGFVLGGNYAPSGIASTGCSGALFGILALELLSLLYTWRERKSPIKDLLLILLDVVISFVLGLLPGLDNFSHIGGFLMGLLLGVVLMHSPTVLRERIERDQGYAPYYQNTSTQYLNTEYSGAVGATGPTAPGRKEFQSFFKNPVDFFKGRKPLWWAWWLARAIALVAALVTFIVLLNNFYKYRKECHWCKYLSCLPIKTNGVNWCDIGDLTFTNQTNPAKRWFEPTLPAF